MNCALQKFKESEKGERLQVRGQGGHPGEVLPGQDRLPVPISYSVLGEGLGATDC